MNRGNQVKMFWQDPYLTELRTEALKICENKVIPKETIIFSFSGGQESDAGWINGLKVINSYYQNDAIIYEMEEPLNPEVYDLTLKIDWEKRYRIMKLHSAAHIVYYFAKEILNFDKVIGSNVTSHKSRLDFLYPTSISPQVPEIEKKANNFILKAHDILMREDDKNPDIRHWICENYDMLCGGTHVKNTKEIGLIQLKRTNIGKGKERIEITLKE